MKEDPPLIYHIKDKFKTLSNPIVLFNKSHSGSRLLAQLVEECGVFMGAHQNESKDSLDVLELVTYLVLEYYPDYNVLWNPQTGNDPVLFDLIDKVFDRHLEGFERNDRALWGWKLCETTYILPVINFLFPQAKFIHLIRDGRDVAFCDHRQPDNAFWRKIYFNTDRISTWRGIKLNKRSYLKQSYIFNAIHWANSVNVGRHYGMMLGDRYMEVRYEDLCLRFESTALKVLKYTGLSDKDDVIQRIRPSIYTRSVYKYQHQSKRKLQKVLEIIKPLLMSLGYLDRDV